MYKKTEKQIVDFVDNNFLVLDGILIARRERNHDLSDARTRLPTYFYIRQKYQLYVLWLYLTLSQGKIDMCFTLQLAHIFVL
jgi:hypothetical protein